MAGRPRAKPEPEAPQVPADEQQGPRELGLLKQIVGFRFRRIQNHLSRRLGALPEFQGRKPGELSVLALIEANPGLSQVALATEVGLDKAVLVAVLDELESLGWIRRERAARDRRRNLLFTTEEGRRMLARLFEVARENERPVREALSKAEFALLSELLDRIYNECFNRDEE